MKKNKLVKPFVKWAGGKRQLLPEIKKYIPTDYGTYFEPFLGGGAVFLDIQPEKYVVNDVNTEIINVYQAVKNDVENLISHLKEYQNDSDFYYKVRAIDRTDAFQEMTETQRAARIIFLNKTCFNGLFRVNRQGQFNVPFGNYKNPNIINEETLRAVNGFLNESKGKILNTDFERVVKTVKKNDFVYFDPPYDPVSSSSSFTGYTLAGFNRAQQERLRDVCNAIHRKGGKFLLSNSATDFIKELYQEYTIEIVQAGRNINSVGSKRGKVDEVLIRNF